MFTWKEFEVEQQRREEERVQANRHRIVRATINTQKSAVFNLQLAIGKRLVAWGTNLQERCMEMASIYPELTKELLDGKSTTL